jgi:hypothetical protein
MMTRSVSSLLANETGDPTYRDAAIASYQFIMAHMYIHRIEFRCGLDKCGLVQIETIW